MKSIKLLFTLSFLIFMSCKSHETNDKRQYYPNGKIKSELLLDGDKKNKREILYYENGNFKSITNYINNLKEGEQLNF
jgi:antitoxin component YwqK of YwqJK toxin-antitoxin module